MKLLGLDTALDACSVAILDGKTVLARVISPGGKGNAERLLPALEQARLAAGIDLVALDAIAATVGPGSFTGIRTALATARALGLALSRPVWGITTTEVLAAAAAVPGQATMAVIDARRDEVYLQGFAASDTAAELGPAFAEPQLLRIADAVVALPSGPLTLTGSGAGLLLAAAGRLDLTLSPAEPNPDPVRVAQLAALRRLAPKPLYIRPPDAALPAVLQPAAALGVAITSCGGESAAVLSALHGEAFAVRGEPGWSEPSLRDLLAMPGAEAWLAMAGDQPAGFLLLRRAADEAEIVTLAVRPRLQRLGVARRLLQAGFAALAARGVATCFLEVAAGNAPARGLYAALGFAPAGARRGYYPDGGDAIVMKIAIPR